MEDKKIVDLFWQRDENAITVAAAKYGHYCNTIANNILNNAYDAEECVNDTYIGAWNSIIMLRFLRVSKGFTQK